MGAEDDAIDIDAGGVDAVGAQLARRDDLLDFGHGDGAGCSHHRIEVPRRLAIDQIALSVALPGLDDREVGLQPALHHIELAIELAHFLALGHQGADAGLGEEGGNAGAAGAVTLAEVEQLVPIGTLDKDEIHTPGIFVDRIFQGAEFEKRIEQLTVRPRAEKEPV